MAVLEWEQVRRLPADWLLLADWRSKARLQRLVEAGEPEAEAKLQPVAD